MVKNKSINLRVSKDLEKVLRDFAAKNDIKIVDASKEVAKLLKKAEIRGLDKIMRELKF